MTPNFCVLYPKTAAVSHEAKLLKQILEKARTCLLLEKPSDVIRLLLGCCIAVILAISSCTALAAEEQNTSSNAGRGYIDSIAVAGQRFKAQGWAATEQTNRQITSLIVLLDGKEVYAGGFKKNLRPDVAESFQRPQWLNSGWQVSFEIPDDLKTGDYTVAVVARTGTGDSIRLSSSAHAENVYIHQENNEKNFTRVIKLIIACTLLSLAVCFLKASTINRWIKGKLKIDVSEPFIFSTAVVMVSFSYVAMGLTGSSLNLGQASAPFIQMDSINIMGHDQPIRTDEWLVQTPFAIGQYNHKPRFPVVNKNVGEDGQNMMVTSMTSVPIAHVTALAKPATWGFFIFDLRRALAWNWIFPITGCFLALAFTLNRTSGGHWKHGFLFSGLFCSAPYIVAWSFWPAYVIFFPCIIFLCSLKIAQVSTARSLLLQGTLLGLAAAGFFLILYPPWQVSVGYVFIALSAGIIIRDRLYTQLTTRRILTYMWAIGIASIIIAAWWMDASSAIKTMTQTAYPGQRITTGGTTTLPMLLKGFTNITTLQQVNSPLSNQSEIASFYYFLLPLGVLLILRYIKATLSAVEWCLTAACGILLYYMFIGLPVSLAKYSLWGHSTPYRTDLALGLASLILTHALLTSKQSSEAATQTTKIIATIASCTWIYIIYTSVKLLDSSITSELTFNTIALVLSITAAISYYLITEKLKPFIVMSLGLSLASTASFNPVNIAPSVVTLRSNLETTSISLSILKGKRVLVLENVRNTRTPMFLIASGISVINGIHYFPQKTLWARLDPENRNREVYNRYQHLLFVGTHSPAENYVLATPYLDIVTVTVNLETFDFHLSGADIVLAPDSDRAGLNDNLSLSFIDSTMGWSWFQIKDR